MKQYQQLVLAILLVSSISCSHLNQKKAAISTDHQTMLPNGLVMHEYRLSNGMRVILVPNKQAPVFTFQLWVGVGSVQEVLDPRLRRAGLAHLFEHMMFRGTPKNPANTYDKKMSLAGQSGLNATTWFDRTNYFSSLPKDKLDFALDIESDRFANLALDETMFRTEIGAVLGELKMSQDRPSRMAIDTLYELAFPGNPYGKTTIGTENDIRGFSVEEAQYFYKTYYSPNNYTLLLVGDISIREAKLAIEKYFGVLKPQNIPQVAVPGLLAQKVEKRKEIKHPAAQNPSLWIGYRTIPAKHEDSNILSVIAAILTLGEGSLLQQSLIDGGFASHVNADAEHFKDAGLFELAVEIRPGVSEEKIQEKINLAFQKISSGKITEKELARAKNMLLLYVYNQVNSNSGLADALAEGILLADNPHMVFHDISAIKNVSLSDVQSVSKKYLQKNNSSTVFLSPEKKI